MILQLLILHKATAKIRSFFGNSIKKKKYWVIISIITLGKIFISFSQNKKELEEDVSYFAYMFQEDAYLSSNVDVLKQDINLHLS